MRRACLVIALAGCNQVFDLGPTHVVDAPVSDFDGDGVIDEQDNCPELANPDQANSDGDAFGDACDTCPLVQSLSVHDEDGDHVGDACDLCPGRPDFNVDRDGDGVGDLCDPIPDKIGQPNHRVAFEPFVQMPAEWLSETTPWTQATDTIAPNTPLMMNDPGLHQTAITTSGTWMATIGLGSKSAWDSSDGYGFIAEGNGDRLSCIVTCATAEMGTKCIGIAAANGTAFGSVALVPQPTTRLSLLVKSVGAPVCIFDGIEAYAGAIPTNGLHISLLASPRVRVTYFDYIQ